MPTLLARWQERVADRLSPAARLGAIYGAQFLIYGAQLAYLPVWLDSRGLTATGISIATSSAMFIRLVVTPGAAFLADRTKAHAQAIVLLAAIAVASLAALTMAQGFWTLIVPVTMFLLATQTIMPLTETLTMAEVRNGRIDYGRVRLWGSLTFVVANMTVGLLVDATGPGAVLWFLMASALATLAAACLLPRGQPSQDARRKPLSLADAAALLARPWFLLLLLAAGTIQAAHALFYLFGVLHWRAMGLSAFATGTLWAIAVSAEVALFARSAAVLRIAGPFELIIAGGVAAVLRWLLMAADPPLALLVPLQLLHALTYAATHLGTMHVIARLVPDHQAGTAQALMATATGGVLMAGAMLAAGALYTHLAGVGYLGMAALAALGTTAALVLARSRPLPPSAP